MAPATQALILALCCPASVDADARAALALAAATKAKPSPKPAAKPAGCCSSLCVCGCNEGKPCRCQTSVISAPAAAPTTYYLPPVYTPTFYPPGGFGGNCSGGG